jgi:hypothetical protein
LTFFFAIRKLEEVERNNRKYVFLFFWKLDLKVLWTGFFDWGFDIELGHLLRLIL